MSKIKKIEIIKGNKKIILKADSTKQIAKKIKKYFEKNEGGN